MADISCPTCGKLNPAGVDECQYCHAGLTTPMTSSTDSKEQALPPGQDNPPEIPQDSGPVPPEEESGTPDWLRRIRSRLASERPSGETGLDGLDPPERETGEEIQEGIAGEEAEIPSGDFPDGSAPGPQAGDTVPVVPVESPASEPVEAQGPLAALGEATSPEQFLRDRPHSAFSYNLRISSTQHAHADLLDSIIDSEGIAVPLARRKEAAASPLLRWAVAAILFISILWPIASGQQQAPLPFFAEEVGQVNNLIEQLPEEASVLLAFDYDPGFSGELDAAAAAVVDHLVSRGAYLTLVSTIPTGPVLAERFLSRTVGRHDLVRNTHYVNLGFVPGGPAGLLSLAEDLQRTLPYTLDGEPAWSGDGEPEGRSEFLPLEGVERLSDFSLVLILVDDSFTARSWIEQVQPGLAGESFRIPMAMVVSAQVEPLVRPYYDANPRQIQGFVAGLRGGTAYEQMTGRETMPGQSWDAFVFGSSAAGLLLLIGGLAALVLTLYDQRGQDQNGGRA